MRNKILFWILYKLKKPADIKWVEAPIMVKFNIDVMTRGILRIEEGMYVSIYCSKADTKKLENMFFKNKRGVE